MHASIFKHGIYNIYLESPKHNATMDSHKMLFSSMLYCINAFFLSIRYTSYDKPASDHCSNVLQLPLILRILEGSPLEPKFPKTFLQAITFPFYLT